MNKIRNLSLRSPILFCLLFVLAVDGIILGLSRVTALFPKSNLTSLLTELLHLAWPILLVFLLGYGFVCKTKGFVRTFKAGWVYLALFSASALIVILRTVTASEVQWESWEKILIGILSLLGIGIREELLYRGVLVNALGLKYVKDEKGLWITTVIAALIFGFTHMTNVFFGLPFANALIQSLGATGIGLGFVAIYLQGGNVWFLALTHAVIDFNGLFQSTFLVNDLTDQDAAINLGISSQLVQISVGIAVALYLFRKAKRQAILDRFDELRAELKD